jgi:Cft2 family RNA processing exonuclease
LAQVPVVEMVEASTSAARKLLEVLAVFVAVLGLWFIWGSDRSLLYTEMLITESTYGSDVHPSRRSQEGKLLQAITQVVETGSFQDFR